MRRLAGLAILLLAAMLPRRVLARDAAADCAPVSDLVFRAAAPVLRQVAAGAARVHFVKDGSAVAGCPGAGPACTAAAFLVPGDLVIVTGTHDGYACATFTGRGPHAAVTSGWLPLAALASAPHALARGWIGDWRSGPEQDIVISRAPAGRIALEGEATFGGQDPARVQRGAVNTGAFAATVAPAGRRLGFMIGQNGKPRAFDARRAKAQMLCALRFWRLGPYLVAADNLKCGGNGVTFTGIYRRAGAPA